MSELDYSRFSAIPEETAKALTRRNFICGFAFCNLGTRQAVGIYQTDTGGNHTSPLVDQKVVITEIVTAVDTSGYARQDRVTTNETPTGEYTMLDASTSVVLFVGDIANEITLRGMNLENVEARNHGSLHKGQAPLPDLRVEAAIPSPLLSWVSRSSVYQELTRSICHAFSDLKFAGQPTAAIDTPRLSSREG